MDLNFIFFYKSTIILARYCSFVRYVAYYGHFHRYIWLLTWFENFLIWLALVNNKDVIKRANWRFSFSSSDHIGPLNLMFTIEPRMVNILWAHNPISNVPHVFLMSILNYKPCCIPLNYRCPIKKSEHIRSTYITPAGFSHVWYLQCNQWVFSFSKCFFVFKYWKYVIGISDCCHLYNLWLQLQQHHFVYA